MNYLILGLYDDREDVEEAIDELNNEGYEAKDLSIIMKDSKDAQTIEDNTGVNVSEAVVTGGTTGAVIGGLAGLLVGIGAITIPGIGALFIAGPIATALGLTGAAASTAGGAMTGAIAGGLLGGLMSLGLPREKAESYESRIKSGAILLAVPSPTGEEDEVEEILKESGAADITRIANKSTLRDMKYRRQKNGNGKHARFAHH